MLIEVIMRVFKEQVRELKKRKGWVPEDLAI
jgi:hypothetical protein